MSVLHYREAYLGRRWNNLFKHCYRSRIAGIFIWVATKRHFLVSILDLVLVGLLRDLKYLIECSIHSH